MSDTAFTLLMAAVGIAIAAAALPWKKHLGMDEDNPVMYWAVWAFMWPILLAVLLWVGWTEYKAAWGRYLDHRRARAANTPNSLP